MRSGIGGADWMYLPVRHTALDVTRPVQTRRHFIEFFIWIPYTDHRIGDRPMWGLQWFVYEVDRDDVRDVRVGHELQTITASQPPLSQELESLAEVRVNSNGESEWAVRGQTIASGVIPLTEAP